MTEPTAMGKVLAFPPTLTDSDDIQDDIPAGFTADGAGDGGGNDRPAVSLPDPDDGDDDGVRVRVDSPAGSEPGKLTTALATRRAHRRPIIAPWLRDADEFRDVSRWTAGHIGHTVAYHAVRVPTYAGRLSVRAPRGAVKVVAGLGAWCADAEAMPLRAAAVAATDADAYMKLTRMRDDRVRWRRIVTASAAAGVIAGAALLLAAPGLVQVAVLTVVVAVLGWYGSPADKPLLDVAVVVPRVQKLTSEIVVRALSALGIGEVNKAMARGGEGITFPAPIQRDGPGWRADVELPYGVTVSDVMDRRDRLASGLRRPLGAVWPEGVPDEHPGRMALWVGDRDMSQTKPAPWPLAKAGRVNLFEAFPFGTDPRARAINLTLMYANVLIGAMPGMGKTFALRVLVLAAALDPLAQLRVFELKGTGDLSATEKVAHHYASGQDDETLAACLDSLRQVAGDLQKRAKTIRSLPKDVCPENKVTPELAAKKSLGLFPLVVVIDECQNLFSHAKYGKEAGELSTTIIKLGRALGVILLLATQRPDKESLPTAISANVGIRYCLRVMGQLENDMILGTSMYKKGIQATTFTKKDKGIGWLVGDADEPQIGKSYYIDNPGADVICDRARALRKAAGTLTGYAAGEDNDLDPARTSLLDDILTVTGPDEDKVRSYVVVDRLAELHPATYGAWVDQPAEMDEPRRKTAKATHLAAALKPYGVKTVQVNRKTETGEDENSRGIIRADIATAAETRNRPAD
jgi:DNA segregation ATPase FtsK/SpoIIIE, S-DNA-T family